VKDLNFKLIPQAVITGRVTDADGDPMPHVGVNVMQTFHIRDSASFHPSAAARQTTKAVFRIANLSPDPIMSIAKLRACDDLQGCGAGGIDRIHV